MKNFFYSLKNPTNYSRFVPVKQIEDGIQFLIQKGILCSNTICHDPSLIEFQFNQMRNPKNKSPYVQRRRDRLLRITMKEAFQDIYDDKIPFNIDQFDINRFPYYSKDNLFILKYPDALVQSVQSGGLCYMQAAIVVQHYLVYLSSKETKEMKDMKDIKFPTLDLVNHIRNNFSADQLYNYIMTDYGGSSSKFFKSILLPGTTTMSRGTNNLSTSLDIYGPGLVCEFEIHDDFLVLGSFAHYGLPKGSKRGFHSMAIIGYRIDETNNKKYYLLQNWWHMKQFFEVDEIYLEACSPYFIFVKTPQTKIANHFPQKIFKYYEIHGNIDKPDNSDMKEISRISSYYE